MDKELQKQAQKLLLEKIGKEKTDSFLKAVKKYNNHTQKFTKTIEPILKELDLSFKIDMGFVSNKKD